MELGSTLLHKLHNQAILLTDLLLNEHATYQSSPCIGDFYIYKIIIKILQICLTFYHQCMWENLSDARTLVKTKDVLTQE